jgi:hypothetical protein
MAASAFAAISVGSQHLLDNFQTISIDPDIHRKTGWSAPFRFISQP